MRIIAVAAVSTVALLSGAAFAQDDGQSGDDELGRLLGEVSQPQAPEPSAQPTAKPDAVAQDQPPAEGEDALGEPDELDLLLQGPDQQDSDSGPARVPVSVTLRALDKITARYRDITAPIGSTVRFGTLRIKADTCYKRPPDEFPETTAFLEIRDVGLEEAKREAAADAQAASLAGAQPGAQDGVQDATTALAPGGGVPALRDSSSAGSAPAQSGPSGEVQAAPTPSPVAPVETAEIASPAVGAAGSAQTADPAAADPSEPAPIFEGWMFASSPALNALEHPVYDVWVIDCAMVAKTEPGEASSGIE